MRILNTVPDLGYIRLEKPSMIYYASHTCWWTHDPGDLWKLITRANGKVAQGTQLIAPDDPTPYGVLTIPSDPRGSVLFQTDDVEGFLRAAEEHPTHYGKYGLKALVAAHAKNCVDDVTGRPWSSPNWEDYNLTLEQQGVTP